MACTLATCVFLFGSTSYIEDHGSLGLEPGTHVEPDGGWGGGVGGASSIKVPEGFAATVYTDRECTAQPHTYIEDTPQLVVNDVARCVVVRAPGDIVTIYGGTGYSDNPLALGVGTHDWSMWKDSVGGPSSIKIAKGFTVTIEGVVNGAMKSMVLTEDTTRLGVIGDNARTIKVEATQ